MEVNRTRVKQYGLNLSEYALGGIFSPEVSPNGAHDDDDARPRPDDRDGRRPADDRDHRHGRRARAA